MSKNFLRTSTAALIGSFGALSGATLYFLHGRTFPNCGHPDVEYVAFFAMLFAQIKLLAVWLAVGSQRFWLRALLAIVGLAGLTLYLTAMRSFHKPWESATNFSPLELSWTAACLMIEVLMAAGLLAFLTAGNVALPRGCRWRTFPGRLFAAPAFPRDDPDCRAVGDWQRTDSVCCRAPAAVPAAGVVLGRRRVGRHHRGGVLGRIRPQ
jgi:hypothetical protein